MCALRNVLDIVTTIYVYNNLMLYGIFFFYSIIAPHPNTYTFTKRLAETVVAEYGNELPIVIVRPSIGTVLFYTHLSTKN